MASTAEDLRNRDIKLVKADGPQFVQRNDKLHGTKAVEPNNATSPHEVEVPSLDRLDLNENSNGAIEDFSDDAWLRKLLYGEGKRRRTMKWKRLPPPDADFSSLLEGLLDPPGVC
ncbi:uncharacterized protein LOC133717484 isoform X3 [Rosa rugosa]|uniref:uncharacterized protein LOC133717484 isoform X3 n=1 Tax=Rosa rugosa TaxID=74645 RepID=UPI002B40BBDE|nr:uncharacterized protein LOC133717484 isoform X3 [Rosa rugosa]